MLFAANIPAHAKAPTIAGWPMAKQHSGVKILGKVASIYLTTHILAIYAFISNDKESLCTLIMKIIKLLESLLKVLTMT